MLNRIACFVLVVIPTFCISQSLNKAHVSFSGGHYEAASTMLYQLVLREDPNPAAQYLLARTFFMKDNPQYNLDSANKYILMSEKYLSHPWKKRELKKFEK